MMSPLLSCGTGVMDQLRKSCQKRKYDSLTGSSEDSSYINHKPISIGDSKRTPFSPLNRLDNVSNNCFPLKGNTNDSDEIFGCNPKRIKYSEVDTKAEDLLIFNRKTINYSEMDTKAVIDKIFEPFDDPHALLPIAKTPGPKIPDDFVISSESPKSPEYVPIQVLYSTRKAIMESQKDFCKSLVKHGIDPRTHMASVFSSKKKSSKKVNFECSTPKVYSSISACNTPMDRNGAIDTPLSGVKVLRDFEDSIVSEFNCNFSFTPLQNRRLDLSLNDTLSPRVNIPPEIRATILSGIVCYVDVRCDNENKTDVVRNELLSLGAMVEKNFTKKVTHVVFQEGRVSTYVKAKKEGIPIVSVLWIEACKVIRGIADPKDHYPRRMEKYDDLLPYQTIKKRRIAILNPNSRVRKNLMMFCNDENAEMGTPTSDKKAKRSRRAVTEMKDKKKKPTKTSQNGQHGKKSLFGINEDQENVQPENHDLPDQSNQIAHNCENSSTDDSDLIRAAAIHRRKSAPGKLLSKKNARREDIKAYFQREKNIDNDIEKDIDRIPKECEKLETDDIEALIGSPGITKLKDDDDDVELNSLKQDNGGVLERIEQLFKERRVKKTQKGLIDIQQDFINSDGSPVKQDDRSSSNVSIPSYIVDTTPKRARTKATNPGRSLKITVARKLYEKKKREMLDDESSPSGLLFVERSPGSLPKKPQHPPSITLTSIPKRDENQYIEIVNKLGKFTIEEKVTKRTTHVVSNGPRRTINLVKGIARGCWLVDLKWLVESEKYGRWLPEEDFDLSSCFPAAQECCRERRGLKSTRVVDVFKSTGQIYVSANTAPRRKDLIEILRICSAKITFKSSSADIIIGKHQSSSSSATNVTEKWALDCVTQNSLLPYEDYLMTRIEQKDSK